MTLNNAALRPRTIFTMSVSSLSRSPRNRAPVLRATWRSAYLPASPAQTTCASTAGASAQIGGASWAGGPALAR